MNHDGDLDTGSADLGSADRSLDTTALAGVIDKSFHTSLSGLEVNDCFASSVDVVPV